MNSDASDHVPNEEEQRWYDELYSTFVHDEPVDPNEPQDEQTETQTAPTAPTVALAFSPTVLDATLPVAFGSLPGESNERPKATPHRGPHSSNIETKLAQPSMQLASKATSATEMASRIANTTPFLPDTVSLAHWNRAMNLQQGPHPMEGKTQVVLKSRLPKPISTFTTTRSSSTNTNSQHATRSARVAAPPPTKIPQPVKVSGQLSARRAVAIPQAQAKDLSGPRVAKNPPKSYVTTPGLTRPRSFADSTPTYILEHCRPEPEEFSDPTSSQPPALGSTRPTQHSLQSQSILHSGLQIDEMTQRSTRSRLPLPVSAQTGIRMPPAAARAEHGYGPAQLIQHNIDSRLPVPMSSRSTVRPSSFTANPPTQSQPAQVIYRALKRHLPTPDPSRPAKRPCPATAYAQYGSQGAHVEALRYARSQHSAQDLTYPATHAATTIRHESAHGIRPMAYGELTAPRGSLEKVDGHRIANDPPPPYTPTAAQATAPNSLKRRHDSPGHVHVDPRLLFVPQCAGPPPAKRVRWASPEAERREGRCDAGVKPAQPAKPSAQQLQRQLYDLNLIPRFNVTRPKRWRAGLDVEPRHDVPAPLRRSCCQGRAAPQGRGRRRAIEPRPRRCGMMVQGGHDGHVQRKVAGIHDGSIVYDGRSALKDG